MDREVVIEAAVAFVAVALLTAMIIGVGVRYNSNGLTPAGGLALVGSVAFFVVFMSVVGYLLARREPASKE